MPRKKAQPCAPGARTRPAVDKENAKLHPACYTCFKRHVKCSVTDPEIHSDYPCHACVRRGDPNCMPHQKDPRWRPGKSGATNKSRKRKAEALDKDDDDEEESEIESEEDEQPAVKKSRRSGLTKRTVEDDQEYAPKKVTVKKAVRKHTTQLPVVESDSDDADGGEAEDSGEDEDYVPAKTVEKPSRKPTSKPTNIQVSRKRAAESDVENGDEIVVAAPKSKKIRLEESAAFANEDLNDTEDEDLSDDENEPPPPFKQGEEQEDDDDTGYEDQPAAPVRRWVPPETVFDYSEQATPEPGEPIAAGGDSEVSWSELSSDDCFPSPSSAESGLSLEDFDPSMAPSSCLVTENTTDAEPEVDVDVLGSDDAFLLFGI